MTNHIFEFLTMIFGGSSIITGVMLWQTRRSNVKSADAKATSDVGESLKVTGEVYTFLTAITKNELQEMSFQIQSLKNVANSQDIEISTLKKTLKDYELRCGSCLNPDKK